MDKKTEIGGGPMNTLLGKGSNFNGTLKVEGKDMRVELAVKKLVIAQHHLTEVRLQDLRVKP